MDFQISVIVGILLGGSYLLIYILTKNFVNNLGIKIEKKTQNLDLVQFLRLLMQLKK